MGQVQAFVDAWYSESRWCMCTQRIWRPNERWDRSLEAQAPSRCLHASSRDRRETTCYLRGDMDSQMCLSIQIILFPPVAKFRENFTQLGKVLELYIFSIMNALLL
jgi:hypothetical protein